ncbi:DNA-binding NarL/FixJ family response regulator [Thermocatellispora tengchongensis]|uniref:DNA-binding NarL/FixJ family response regulator n=1 Tax=Thermocatellispora tengchongensis TaxID=1073253 RepID=A0A840PD02_9ACTN|nr:response regulator transcription factor [Thermocatellispora tengchongensis]MBB5139294.1 DNA-binding NarL/FixJ family response regulator [Thermocatellispora tengchongensis]
MTRILIVDDESLLRAGLLLIIGSVQGFEAVAVDGAEAVGETRRRRPDVVLLHLGMRSMDGFAVLKVLLSLPDPPRVAVLTTSSVDVCVVRALRMGASGFLSRDGRPEELIASVSALVLGKTVLSPLAVAQLLAELERQEPRAGVATEARRLTAGLTTREHDVLTMMAAGLSNADIGRRLLLGTGTVKDYVSAILSKLRVTNRVQAAMIAYRAGLLDATFTGALEGSPSGQPA